MLNKLGLGINRRVSGAGLLLDLISGAVLAVSLYKLYSGYSGNCLKVRRASDSTTQDIGFVGNFIDVTSLESFCSGTDGFVDTWYNQFNGGNDAIQTTNGYQPQIVNSGSFLSDGIYFDGIDDYLSVLDYSEIQIVNYPLSLYANWKNVNSAITYIICKNYNGFTDQQWALFQYNNMIYMSVAYNWFSIAHVIGGNNKTLGTWKQSFKTINNNGNFSSTPHVPAPANKQYTYIGACSSDTLGNTVREFTGNIKTVLIFNTDQESNYDQISNEC